MVKSSERRDGPRIDLRLRVRYEAVSDTRGGDVGVDVGGEAEASDVSPKGLRLESDKPVDKGTALKLHVDAGELEELEAMGSVTWCRPRATPTGKTMYDLGVSFESDWLSKDRGPLGSALARIFAMNSYEPARSFERTPVSIGVSSTSSAMSIAEGELEIANLSVGGMQFRSKSELSDHLRAGIAVKVEVQAEGGMRTLPGKVAWVAGGNDGAAPGGARVSDSFGVEFESLSQDDRAMLERIRTGQTDPVRIIVALES